MTDNVVVPGYYLVWYNSGMNLLFRMVVVVPGYYLVWYNKIFLTGIF